MAQHRFMVCIGSRTVALTTTQREAEAEAARVGGKVYELATKNPPDPDYDVVLGGGAFSKAYARKDAGGAQAAKYDKRAQKRAADAIESARVLGEFYYRDGKPLDRGTRGAEAVTRFQPYSVVTGQKDVIDVSKLIVELARLALKDKGDRKAMAYLPDFRMLRLDFTGDKGPEFIYKMPVYKAWEHGGSKLATAAADAVYNAILRDGHNYNGQWIEGTEYRKPNAMAQKFAENMRKHMPAATHKEIEPVTRALEAVHGVASQLPLAYYQGDAHSGNFAVAKNGHLILLDVFFAEMKWDKAQEYWKSLGGKIKQVKAAKAPKAKGAKKAAKPASAKKATAKTPQRASKALRGAVMRAAAEQAAKPAKKSLAWIDELYAVWKDAYPEAQVAIERGLVPGVVLRIKGRRFYSGVFYVANSSKPFLAMDSDVDREPRSVYCASLDKARLIAQSSFEHELALAGVQAGKPARKVSSAVKSLLAASGGKETGGTRSKKAKPASVKKATTKKPATAKPATAKKAASVGAYRQGMSLEEMEAFNTRLAKEFQRLKKEAGAKSVTQNYRGQGNQKFARQLWVSFTNGAVIDLWLESRRVKLGGVALRGFADPSKLHQYVYYHSSTPAEIYAAVRDNLLEAMGGVKPATAKKAPRENKVYEKKRAEVVNAVFRKVFGNIQLPIMQVGKIMRAGEEAYDRAVKAGAPSVNLHLFVEDAFREILIPESR